MRYRCTVLRPEDVDRFADSIRAESLASYPVACFPGTMPCCEAWAQIRPGARDLYAVVVHDLEDTFWLGDDKGKWARARGRRREGRGAHRGAHVGDVKDALQKLLDAPTPKAKSRRRRKK